MGRIKIDETALGLMFTYNYIKATNIQIKPINIQINPAYMQI
ncbi:MAG: hypothetical protein QM541_10815 [Flavobacterium sp.]|nr:hypothetical protein [Flavobacterium sp.]